MKWLKQLNWILGAVAGLITGSAMYIHFTEERYLEPQRQMIFTFGSWGVLAVCIVFTVIAYRKMHAGISLGQTMIQGLSVSAMRGVVIIFIYSGLYLNNAEMFEKPAEMAIENYIDNMDENDKSDENLLKVKEAITSQFTPLGQAKSVLFESLIIGAIISVLTAGFLARPANKRIIDDKN
jgi:uncharacterized membrane protein (DUF485 family)